MTKDTDIAIVGMSCIFPGADSVSAFWNNLVQGVDSTSKVPADRIDPGFFQKGENAVDSFYCDRGGFMPEVTFDPLKFGIPPITIEGFEPEHLIVLKYACLALEDAGVFEKGRSLNKTSIIIAKGNYTGTAMIRAHEIVRTGEEIAEVVRSALPDLPEAEVDKIKKLYQKQKGRFQADTIPGIIPNLIASMVANKLNLGGAAYTVDAACASALIALDHAVHELLSNRSDMVIVSGLFLAHDPTAWSIFSQLGALSRKKKLTPFSVDADGLLIGEGCGVVVLKRLESAIADNDKIYAVVKGVGVSSDGSATGLMAPSAEGQTRAIRAAWQNAGLNPEEVHYIEAHGTGTVIGDKTEVESMVASFGRDKNLPEVLFGSVKSNIGHTMPAAGIAGLIKTALILYYGKIPPTLYCENPLPQIKDSCFRPVTELTDWEMKTPGLAGVSAFGFGGINAHVVLQSYTRKNGASLLSPPDQAVALTATSREKLLEILKNGDFENGDMGGNYRLLLFNSTPEKIEKAKTIVAEDKPWKGQEDIWFTNAPLLKNHGKVAFLYSGLDALNLPETKSVEDYFNLSLPTDQGWYNSSLIAQGVEMYRCIEVVDTALLKLGVRADLNIGFFISEWLTLKASGVLEEKALKQVLQVFEPDLLEMEKVCSIEIESDVDKVGPWIDTIPNLYLSNENYGNRAIVYGYYDSISLLIEKLEAENIHYERIPFHPGFQIPLGMDRLDQPANALDHLRSGKISIPVWTNDALDRYPGDLGGLKSVVLKHLTDSSCSKDLILSLYHNERVRVFIQVGTGSLTDFVEDPLGGLDFSMVSATDPKRTSLEQLKRVLALLFIEGRDVDFAFLGLKRAVSQKGIETKLKLGLPLIRDFSYLKSLSERYRKKDLLYPELPELSGEDHPVVAAIRDNMGAIYQMHSDMFRFVSHSVIPSDKKSITHVSPEPEIKKEKKERSFERKLNVSIENYPELIDHSIIKQPPGWPFVGDRHTVIPMTMTAEMMAEEAHIECPEKKIQSIRSIAVFQWLKVAEPFVEKVKGVWIDDNTVKVDISSYAKEEVVFGDNYLSPPDPSEYTFDIGKPIIAPPSPERVYNEIMFHGPAYQGIVKIEEICERGARGYVRKAKGKGSLLDNAAQVFGVLTNLITEESCVAFPVTIDNITFYGDMHDDEGIFECVCVLRDRDREFESCDIFLKREDKLWCKIINWKNRRLEIDKSFWGSFLNPRRHLLATQMSDDGAFFFHNVYRRVLAWEFARIRYFNQNEKKFIESIPVYRQKTYIISRIAVKDAVRDCLFRKTGRELYPIEFQVDSDERHRPYISGLDGVDVYISLAHKGTDAVAIAADKPVGIDMENMEIRSDEFMQISYTEGELELLKDRDNAEWSTRFWVAKEAYGKMVGTGLLGNPKRYEVNAILENDILIINGVRIKTVIFNDYIVGWTL